MRLDRRDLTRGLIGSLVAGLCLPAEAQTLEQAFLKDLEALAQDPAVIGLGASPRERLTRLPGDPLGAQASFWSRASTTAISDLARQLIVTFEVSGQSEYQRRYQRPIWPKGQSGVTIGIGYDLGYNDQAKFAGDWGHLIDASSFEKLKPALGVRGAAAEPLARGLQEVVISWTPALKQFDSFLPFAIGKTEDTFPNASGLPGHSLGALVSLVYNRGPSLSPTSSRRREMRQIYTLMKELRFKEIPQKIRDMKRIWADDPNLRGLVIRREKEAQLFELGFKAS
jgi:hypothetical protein